MKHFKSVTEKYFGMGLADSQSADEPYDPAAKVKAKDGVYMTGRGVQGGGSKATPQANRNSGRSSKTASSAPKDRQRIRG